MKSIIKKDIYLDSLYSIGYNELDKYSPLAERIKEYYYLWYNPYECDDMVEKSYVLHKVFDSFTIVLIIYDNLRVDVFDTSNGLTLIASPRLEYTHEFMKLIVPINRINGIIDDKLIASLGKEKSKQMNDKMEDVFFHSLLSAGYKVIDEQHEITNVLHKFYTLWFNEGEADDIVEDSIMLTKQDIVIVVNRSAVDVYDMSKYITVLSSPELTFLPYFDRLLPVIKKYSIVK